MALKICYVSSGRRTEYNHYNADGTETDHQPGTMLEIFVPDERREDVDRNADMREELSEAIDAAITVVESA
jgi:hypothetical protein